MQLNPSTLGTGACLLYGIKRVVIGENENFIGGEDYLRQRGVQVVVLDSSRCKGMMAKFIAEKPELWFVRPRTFIFPLLYFL
jgi:cytosine deaminase